MTEEITQYISNATAILELMDNSMSNIAKANMRLEVLTRLPNSTSNQDLFQAKKEVTQVLDYYMAEFSAARKVISDIYHCTPDELRNHLLDIKIGLSKFIEVIQEEKILRRAFETLLESNVLPNTEDMDENDIDPNDPTTWPREKFEYSLSAAKKQVDLAKNYLNAKINLTSSRIVIPT